MGAHDDIVFVKYDNRLKHMHTNIYILTFFCFAGTHQMGN